MMSLYNNENYTGNPKKKYNLQFEKEREDQYFENPQYSYTFYSRRREECSIKALFEKNGDVYIFEKFNKTLVSRIRMVNFQIKKDTFFKGREVVKIPNHLNNVPNIKFWYNRYYYFSKFDEGIKMDYESKIWLKFRLVFSDP